MKKRSEICVRKKIKKSRVRKGKKVEGEEGKKGTSDNLVAGGGQGVAG